MEQGFAQAAERDEALRREMEQQMEGLRREFQQQMEGLRREFQQQIEGLRRETQQQVEGLRKEMERGFAEVAEQGEVLRREIVRLERWLFALTVPVLVGIVGIIGMLLQIMLK
jgi:F0F1-type ATP synthase membrane subunit b/b'